VDKRNELKLSVRTASQTRNKKRFAKRVRPKLRSLGPKFTANRAKTEQLAALVAEAFRWIARGREANIQVGRKFLLIKAIVGHGQWERYYAYKFGTCGIAKRTAQEYMDLARKEDANAKSAESAYFPKATDRHAVTMRNATAKAEAEVLTSARLKSVAEETGAIFNLQVRLTAEVQEAAKKLRNSADWLSAEREIAAFLRGLCVKFGILTTENK
jgi:hypothetical protein